MNTIANIEFTDFKLRGLYAALAIEKIKAWAANTQAQDDAPAIDNDTTELVFELLDTLGNDTDKNELNELIAQQTMFQDKMQGLTGNAKKAVEKEMATFQKAYGERIMGMAIKHPVLMKKIVAKASAKKAVKTTDPELIKTLYEGVGDALQSLGKNRDVAEQFTTQELYDFVECIVQEKANLVDQSAFFFIQKQKELRATA